MSHRKQIEALRKALSQRGITLVERIPVTRGHMKMLIRDADGREAKLPLSGSPADPHAAVNMACQLAVRLLKQKASA